MSKAKSTSLPADRDHLIVVLKQYAKDGKSQDSTQPLAAFLDAVAKTFHFQNWSVLHKNVAKMTQPQFSAFAATVMADPSVPAFVGAQATSAEPERVDEEGAKEEMREWVRAHYTPLVEFAPLDNESESGFAFDSEDLLNDLQEEFDQRFHYDWIEEVAGDMEMEGPWGIPAKYDDGDGGSDNESPAEGPTDDGGWDDISVEPDNPVDEWGDRL